MKKENLKELKELSKTLYELREEYGYTQQDIADKLKVSYQAYQAYELGRSAPSLTNFIKLADIYDVSLDFLIGRKEL